MNDKITGKGTELSKTVVSFEQELELRPHLTVLDKKSYGNVYASIIRDEPDSKIYVVWTTRGILNRVNGFANRPTDAHWFAINVSKFVPLIDPDVTKPSGIINLFAMPHGSDDVMASYRLRLQEECAWGGTYIADACLLALNELPFFTS